MSSSIAVATIRTQLFTPAMREQLTMALPKHLSVDRLLRVAMTSIQRTPKLLECTPQSLLGCVMTCAQLGLEPDQFTGQAHLVPFWNSKKKVYEAQLIPGYRGLISLARRSGEVQTVSAQVVYQKDHFELEFGLQEKLIHRPSEGDRGNPRGAYVIFRYTNGAHSLDYMPFADIMKIKERSPSKDSGPWVTDEGEMMKKTVIKRHSKLAPLSIEFQRAVALDDRAIISESQMDLIDFAPVDQLPEKETEDPFVEKAFIALFFRGDKQDESVKAFVAASAKGNNVTEYSIKEAALKDQDAFLKAFNAWIKKQKPEPVKQTKKTAPKQEEPEPEPEQENMGVNPPIETAETITEPDQDPKLPPVNDQDFIPCEGTGKRFPIGKCKVCPVNEKCGPYGNYLNEHAS